MFTIPIINNWKGSWGVRPTIVEDILKTYNQNSEAKFYSLPVKAPIPWPAGSGEPELCLSRYACDVHPMSLRQCTGRTTNEMQFSTFSSIFLLKPLELSSFHGCTFTWPLDAVKTILFSFLSLQDPCILNLLFISEIFNVQFHDLSLCQLPSPHVLDCSIDLCLSSWYEMLGNSVKWVFEPLCICQRVDTVTDLISFHSVISPMHA